MASDLTKVPAFPGGEDGAPLIHPPLAMQVELAEDLMDTKVIAEAWDAAGLYQIGHFPGDRWGEWNGRFRHTMRRFVKGEGGIIGQVADAIGGSASLYEAFVWTKAAGQILASVARFCQRTSVTGH